MSSAIYLHNIGEKKAGFNYSLTKNYWLTKIKSIKISFLESSLRKLIDKTLFRVEEISLLTYEAYKEAETIDQEEAKEVYPKIVEFRKTITKQNNQFDSIDYADDKRLKKSFQKLVRLTNRLEAKIHKQAHKHSNFIETPLYIREKMASNSKEIATNALLEEADN